MRACSIALAALALLLSVLLSTSLNRAQAEGRLLPSGVHSSSSSSSSRASSSQAVRDMQADKKNPYKQVDSSFRRIPPSASNPTQNKCKPPLEGDGRR